MPLSQAAAAHQSGDLKQYLSLQCRLQILQPLGWEARLNSAATRIRLANDGDQKFQSVASFIARDLLSDSLPPQMVESDFRLYDGDSLRSKEFQGILPTWTRSRSSQDVGQGCSRSVSRSFARRVFANFGCRFRTSSRSQAEGCLLAGAVAIGEEEEVVLSVISMQLLQIEFGCIFSVFKQNGF